MTTITIKEHPIRWATARFESVCGQCRTPIKIGDKVGQPQVRNEAGGRLFVGAWYCVCCSRLHALEPLRGGWLRKADLDAFSEARSLRIAELLDEVEATPEQRAAWGQR